MSGRRASVGASLVGRHHATTAGRGNRTRVRSLGSFCPTIRLAPRAAGSESGVFLDSPSTRHRGNLEENIEEGEPDRALSDPQTDQGLAETSGAEQVRDLIRSDRPAEVSEVRCPEDQEPCGDSVNNLGPWRKRPADD